MRPLDYCALADALLPAVLAAGRAEMAYFTTGVEVEQKSDASPVTAADREAEAIILDGLWHAARGVPVVAEESASLGALPSPSTSFFLVDPLDGTREFVNRCGEFTVNIGLVSDGVPVFGLIYAPALSALFVTLDKGRAVEVQVAPDARVKSLADCSLTELKTRQPDVDALKVLESRSHRSPATDGFLRGYAVASSIRAGSSLKFCMIARGDADFYARIGPTMEWDTAAGQAILAGAGGVVTRLGGDVLTYGKADVGYLNPHFVAWGREFIPPRSPLR
jgi:3'(2'), 5'-bisphosphate nucleotidase